MGQVSQLMKGCRVKILEERTIPDLVCRKGKIISDRVNYMYDRWWLVELDRVFVWGHDGKVGAFVNTKFTGKTGQCWWVMERDLEILEDEHDL